MKTDGSAEVGGGHGATATGQNPVLADFFLFSFSFFLCFSLPGSRDRGEVAAVPHYQMIWREMTHSGGRRKGEQRIRLDSETEREKGQERRK